MENENKEYKEFVEKFKTKLTTDDCYTPPAVYDVVLDYVKEKCDIKGRLILRPFFPGGNYENYDYSNNCVVVDNPPFSIIAKIIRFYLERDIKFFLFAPHLTVFASNQDYTAIITGSQITYENGANVPTAFVSNLFENEKVIGDAELAKKIKDIQNLNRVCLPSYKYPDNILTVSSIAQIVNKGISISIDKKDAVFCRQMDSQKELKKALFGSGFLISDKAAAEKAAAEKAAAEKAAAKEVTVWEISEREREIIERLK